MSLCLCLSLCIGFVYFLSQTLTGFEILGSSNPTTCTCGLLDSGLKVGMVLPSSRILSLCISMPLGRVASCQGPPRPIPWQGFPRKQAVQHGKRCYQRCYQQSPYLLLADFHPLCPQPGRAAGILGKKPYQLSSGLRWGLLSRSC